MTEDMETSDKKRSSQVIRRSTRISNRSGTAENATVSNDEMDIQKNPLQNPLVINHVFSYSNVDAIKECRLVCKKWNALSLLFLDKKSLIRIGYPENIKGYASEEKSPKNFKEFMKDSQKSFTAFRLESFPNHRGKWPVETFLGFLEDQREIMQELTIDNIDIIGYDGRRPRPQRYFCQRKFTITPYISNHLNHFAIDCSIGTKFTLSMENFISTKSLSLTSCEFILVKNYKLSPEKLQLNYLAIGKSGEKTVKNEIILVNDLINFKNLKELTLKSPFKSMCCPSPYDASLAVDMKGKTTLNMLFLKKIKIQNFQESQWQINKFKLRNVPYKEQTQMKFAELDFANGIIHLNLLPATLKKLTLKRTTIWECQTNQTSLLTLPNLSYLKLMTDEVEYDDEDIEGYKNPFFSLSPFANCENLTTVVLSTKTRGKEYYCEGDAVLYRDLNTDWIPPATKTLFLTGNIQVKEGRELKLEKLVIQDNHLENIFDTVQRLQSNHLILDLNSAYLKWSINLESIILALIDMPYESLAIGSVSKKLFNKMSLAKFVEKEAEYYLFKNKKGNPIMEWEFSGMIREY